MYSPACPADQDVAERQLEDDQLHGGAAGLVGGLAGGTRLASSWPLRY